MAFYEILERIMAERGLCVAEFARMAGLPDSTIRSILTRRSKTVALDVAAKISKSLDIPMDQFCDCAMRDSDAYTPKERELIETYRRLDRWGKEAIERTLVQQARYCK